MRRAAAVSMVIAGALLTGCAAPQKPLYHWEGYERQVYEYLKNDGTTPTEQLAVMQAQAEKARATGSALPPGFRAHLAMLHLRLGNSREARHLVEAEKSAFPESAQYMDFVLKSMGEKKL